MSDLKVFENIINLLMYSQIFFNLKVNYLKMLNIIQQILDMTYEELEKDSM